jgi:hypothetical protein
MTRTVAGRVNIATMLMQMQPSAIKTPEELQQVLDTGRLDPAVEGTRAELLNIRAENEMLQDGKPAMAAFTDNHPMHMREHAAVIASPEARSSPEVLNALSEHMNEHANLWRTTDPTILMAIGVPPPPPPPMMGPPGMAGPPQPGATNGTPPPPEGAADGTGPMAQGPDVQTPGLPPQPNGDAGVMPGVMQ